MLFGTGSRLFGLFATHPPLTERIQALDPNFDEKDYPQVDALAEPAAVSGASAVTSGLAAGLASGTTVIFPDTIAESVGHPEVEHVEYARRVRQAIPESLYDAAHSTELSILLTLALVLDRSGDSLPRQLALLDDRMGEQRTRLVHQYYDELMAIGEEFRLPLLEISFPSLKLRPAPQLTYLVDLASRLIEIDGKVDLYEFCFYRILMINLGMAIDPSGKRRSSRAPKRELRQAAVNLLAIVAEQGHTDAAQSQRAFRAGAKLLGDWASEVEIEANPEYTVRVLNHSLDLLMKLNGKGRRKLLRAVSEVADHDNHLTIVEAELLRVICATLDCPLPPILVHNSPGP